MRRAKGIVQSGCKVAAMLLLLCCVVAGAGCAPLWEGTLAPTDGVRSTQRYYQPPEEAWVVQPSKTVADTFDGEQLVSRVTTEYSMPSAMRDNTFRGDTAFVEQDRTYRFDRTADGDGIEFAATQMINEGAYEVGAAAQVARTDAAINGLAQAVAGLVEVGKVALPKYFDLLTTEANNDAILRQRELDLKEKEIELMALHGGEEHAPAEAATEGGE